MMSVPSGFPSTKPADAITFSFMWAYPNMIPLPPSEVLGIWRSIKNWEFESTYGGFMGQNVSRKGLKGEVLESAKSFVRRGGHEKAGIFEETTV